MSQSRFNFGYFMRLWGTNKSLANYLYNVSDVIAVIGNFTHKLKTLQVFDATKRHNPARGRAYVCPWTVMKFTLNKALNDRPH